MNNRLTAKGVVAIIFILIGFLIGRVSSPDVETIKVAGDERWCFYGEYENMANYKATQAPVRSFITFRGSRVWVFVPCETTYD